MGSMGGLMRCMTLRIDTHSVNSVLLPDNEWHTVEDGSFTVDQWEYVDSSSGQQRSPLGVDARRPGFQFREKSTGRLVSGPVSSVLAVRGLPNDGSS